MGLFKDIASIYDATAKLLNENIPSVVTAYESTTKWMGETYDEAAKLVEENVTPTVSKAWDATCEYACETANEVAEFYSESIAPSVDKAAKATLTSVDEYCAKAVNSAVETLTEYPNINMALQPALVSRMAAANTLDAKLNDGAPCTKNVRSVTVETPVRSVTPEPAPSTKFDIMDLFKADGAAVFTNAYNNALPGRRSLFVN